MIGDTNIDYKTPHIDIDIIYLHDILAVHSPHRTSKAVDRHRRRYHHHHHHHQTPTDCSALKTMQC